MTHVCARQVALPQPSELIGVAAAGRSYAERSTSYGQPSYEPARVPSGEANEGNMQMWRAPGGTSADNNMSCLAPLVYKKIVEFARTGSGQTRTYSSD